MASRYEIYKKSLPQENLDTDIAELEKLYNSKKEFTSNYSFDQFVDLSISNASGTFDSSIKEFYNPSKPTDKLKDNPDYYTNLFGLTEIEKSLKDEKTGWKSTRRSLISPVSESYAAFAGLGRGIVSTASKIPQASPVFDVLDNILPNKKEINRNIDNLFRVGLNSKDIYETKEDKETGETYYELEKPSTTAEALFRPLSELGIALAATKNPIKAGGKFTRDILSATKRKKGRPSKTVLALETRANNRLNKFNKVTDKYGTLLKAEVASQFTFVDDPEFAIVAGHLSNFIGDDDNRLADLFNYLDTDEDSSETARRLSLLLDGAAFGGLFATVLGAGKVGVTGATNFINKVKKEGPEAVDQFKKLINVSRTSESATKIVNPKKVTTDVPLLVDLKYRPLDSPENILYKGIQKAWQGLKTRGGMYAPGMLDIIKGSEYTKIHWSDRAVEIHSKLIASIKQAKKNSSLDEDGLENVFELYLTKAKNKDGKLQVKLKDLPKEMQEHAKEARDQIDSLSKMLGTSKHIPLEIREEIQKNMGMYLRKTFEAFENPNFRPSKQLVDTAIDQIIIGLKASDANAGRVRPRPEGYYLQEATQYVDKLVNKNKGKLFNNYENHINSVFGAGNAAIIFKSKNIELTPAIEALLGGKVKASTSVFRTIDKLSSEISQHKLMDELYEQGLGKWFFTGKGKNAVAPDVRMVDYKITGQGFHKLNGVKTSEGIAELFENMKNPTAYNPLFVAYGQALKLKGFSQAAATVYNATTHVRNTVGGAIILARNGMNPFSSETKDSFRVLKNKLNLSGKSSLEKNKALTELYSEYQRLGLVNQNVKVGEFKRLFNEFSNNNSVEDSLKTLNGFSFKKLNKKITDVYVAEDDLWRIAGYNKELDVLKEANKLNLPAVRKTEAVLKQEAADIIRDTMPTYDLIAPTIQKLRRLPVGNFFSFSAEQFRNNYNTMLRGMKEIKSGNEVLVARGMKRLGSQISITYALGKGATDLSKKYYGITDEEEQAVRDVGLAEWSKNSALVFNRTESGNIEYIDLTYTDPSAPVTDILRSFLNEVTDKTTPQENVADKLLNGVQESMKLFLKPFLGPAILTDKIVDVTFGQGKDFETGRLIEGYNPAEGKSIDNMTAIFMHVGSGLVPKEIAEDYSLAFGAKSKRLKTGEISLGNELFAKITGQRTSVMTPTKIQKNLGFKLYALSDARTEQKEFLRGELSPGTTPEQFLKQFERANSAYYKTFAETKLALEASYVLGIDKKFVARRISSALRGFTNADKGNFMSSNNSFIPLKLTESQLKLFKRRGDFSTMTFTTFYQEYKDMLGDYYQLPILRDDEKEYREYTAGELNKKGYATGGYVKGEKVPFTKENPTDRADSNSPSRKSYAENANIIEQLNKLGLK